MNSILHQQMQIMFLHCTFGVHKRALRAPCLSSFYKEIKTDIVCVAIQAVKPFFFYTRRLMALHIFPLNIHLAGCLSPTLCSGHDRGPFDLSLSNHAWFCFGLSALVTLGLVHDTGSYSFVLCFSCSFAVTLRIPVDVLMYLPVNKILLLNVSRVQHLVVMFLLHLCHGIEVYPGMRNFYSQLW